MFVNLACYLYSLVFHHSWTGTAIPNPPFKHSLWKETALPAVNSHDIRKKTYTPQKEHLENSRFELFKTRQQFCGDTVFRLYFKIIVKPERTLCKLALILYIQRKKLEFKRYCFSKTCRPSSLSLCLNEYRTFLRHSVFIRTDLML